MASTLQERIGVPVSTVQPFPATDADFGAGVYATAVPASLVIANRRGHAGRRDPATHALPHHAPHRHRVLSRADRRNDEGHVALPGDGWWVAGGRRCRLPALEGAEPVSCRGARGVPVRAAGSDDPARPSTTTTREKEIDKFVEDILTIGGYVVAVLLLFAPEAAVTKPLALAMLGLGVGYGVHRISRNVELGVGVFDSRNVLEAVGILGSAVGIGGSALRTAGLRASRPLMYRAGNWMVISTVATDVGTLTYVGVESYDMLRASMSDPNLSDADRIALLARNRWAVPGPVANGGGP